uniref:Uncharacterized protein n=1 Tax=Oryza sativa subsp. japonica TaxID=39947 RepID=Q654F0_ORYSJ|nr:hypothetical protein [Oryza sativa Japonica Group]BAD61678.1 hypothetical protein [Oryza sativa Japonica Group]
MPQKKRQGPVLAAAEWSRGRGGKEQSEGGRSARWGAHRSPRTSPERRKGMKETEGEMKKKGKTFPTFRRRAFPLRKVPKRLRKLKASHTVPKQPFEHVDPI